MIKKKVGKRSPNDILSTLFKYTIIPSHQKIFISMLKSVALEEKNSGGKNRGEIEIIFLQNFNSLFNASITHNLWGLSLVRKQPGWCMTLKYFNSLIHQKVIQKLLIVVLSEAAISVLKLGRSVTYQSHLVAFHSIRELRVCRELKAAGGVLLGHWYWHLRCLKKWCRIGICQWAGLRADGWGEKWPWERGPKALLIWLVCYQTVSKWWGK